MVDEWRRSAVTPLHGHCTSVKQDRHFSDYSLSFYSSLILVNSPSTLHLSTFENALFCLVQRQAEPEE